MALFLAYAEADDIPVLATETYAQGGRRLANDMQAALQILNQDDNWKDAHLMIEQGSLRERRALNSVRVIAANNGPAEKTIDTFLSLVDGREKQLVAELSAFYQNKYGKTPTLAMTAEETAASKKVPANTASLDEYFAKRRNAQTSLHSHMSMATMSFVDGKRSYYDIYKAVKAENQAAGKFYYGTVTFADVVKVLDGNVAAGALTLK